MKEIKAFMHRGRAADIVHALLAAGFDQVSLVDVKGTLHAITPREADYSVEYGESMITEVKLEVVCNDDQVDRVLALLRSQGRPSRASGWVYVSDIERSMPLDPGPAEGGQHGA